MPLQEETAQPLDPLATLESDYFHAVLHLAWDLHKRTKERRLLFGLVELLPAEVPPPFDDSEEARELTKSERRVFVRHATVPARRALDWYLGCRRGEAVLPEEDGTVPAPDDERARRLGLHDLGEEPPWPSLSLVTERDEVVPFCPTWHGQPRAHHLIPLTSLDVAALWPSELDRQRAVQFLSERLHFDLADYPEYWGSVHLVAPNPLFRKIEGRRLPTSTEQVDQQLYRLHPRAGKALTGLTLAIDERRATGECETARIALKTPLVQVTFGHRSGSHKETIRDPLRGLLETRHSLFLHGFNAELSMGDNRRRAVQVSKTSRHRPAEEYEVPMRRTGRTILIQHASPSEPRIPGAEPRLAAARRSRKAQDAVRSLRERWFNDDVQEATNLLRSLLGEARREVLIVDRYFALQELFRFALAVGQVDVPISILTSKKGLNDSDPWSNNRQKGDALHAELQALAARSDMNAVHIRVMRGGDDPVIHDRFLLVDDRIWLLGSSFNEFGSRGTMLVALSHPERVRDKLRRAWNEADELAMWLEKHPTRIRAAAQEGS